MEVYTQRDTIEQSNTENESKSGTCTLNLAPLMDPLRIQLQGSSS